eukprot:m.193206 g.193206  ORF g.193206 m.193206 type:complete len:110 (-) comp53681_c0_seq7:642-971(-)
MSLQDSAEVDALLEAVAQRQLSQCQHIVQTGGKELILVQHNRWLGQTALHYAARTGRTKNLDWFLQQEVDFNAGDRVFKPSFCAGFDSTSIMSTPDSCTLFLPPFSSPV